MHGPLVGEFMGTLVLILLGDGVVANVLLKKTKGENSGWIVITTAWGLAVVAGNPYRCGMRQPGGAHQSGSDVGVCVSVGKLGNRFSVLGAQFLGAFVGAVLVWLAYLPHWKETADQGAKLGALAWRRQSENFLQTY